MSNKEIQLNSGKRLAVKLPPMTMEFMEQLQKTVVKNALVNPEVFAVLSKDEVQELFLKVSELNREYWAEQAQKLIGAGLT